MIRRFLLKWERPLTFFAIGSVEFWLGQTTQAVCFSAIGAMMVVWSLRGKYNKALEKKRKYHP